MTLFVALIATLISAAVIVAAGVVLARSGDIIAARTSLGGVWVGSVLLAGATSLPEIATDIAAVRLGAFDLAAGDLFGSSMANMFILAIITLIPAGTHLFRRAALDHVLYAVLAIMLTAMAVIFLLIKPGVAFAGVGFGSLLLIATYAAGSRVVFRHATLASRTVNTEEMSGRREEAGAAASAPGEGRRELRRGIAAFAGAALVILLAAPFFAKSAEAVAQITGVGSTVVGTWLVGFSTSLPELVTCLAAVRIGAFDMAVGNLFGSNAFNMSVFVVLDFFTPRESFFRLLDPLHAVSGLVAIVLMGIGIAAIAYRAQGKFTLLEPSSALIVLGYFAGLVVLIAGSV